jgi:hypothetical protein
MPTTTIKTNQFLTNFSTSYKLKKPVADFISPPFKVKNTSDKYAEYSKSVLRMYDNKIKGKQEPREASWNVTESTYLCEMYADSKWVPDTTLRNADKIFRPKQDAVKWLKQFMELAREKRVYEIAGSTSIVTNFTNKAGAWSTASSGTPVADILGKMGSIEDACLQEPNKITMTYRDALVAIQTDEWKDYFKHTNLGFANGLFNAIAGLRHLGLEPMITGARGLSTYEGTASDPASETLWDKKVLIFYSENRPTLNSRTFMFSPFTFKGLVKTLRDERKGGGGVNIDMWEEIDELLVDANCAGLLTNVRT